MGWGAGHARTSSLCLYKRTHLDDGVEAKGVRPFANVKIVDVLDVEDSLVRGEEGGEVLMISRREKGHALVRETF